VLYYEPFYLFVTPGYALARKKRIREQDLDLREI